MRIIHSALIFLSFQVSASIAQESTEVFGEGLVKTAPDYVLIKFNVNSECEPDPQAAQRATDEVSKRIYDYLEKKLGDKKDHYFKIFIDGGFTAPYSRWIQRRSSSQIRAGSINSSENQEICRNTFQKSTRITLKIGMRDNFSHIFSDIQDFAFKNFIQNFIDDQESPRTYVSMERPSPAITRQHRLQLERQALDHAVREAKGNFLALIKSCEAHRYKILSIREQANPYEAPVLRASMQRIAPEGLYSSSDNAAPVYFDTIKIIKRVAVTFQFDGSLCFEKNSATN